MEVETETCWRPKRTASLSLRGETANAKSKPFPLREKTKSAGASGEDSDWLFQTGQVVGIVAALLTIERLSADPEVTAGASDVAIATIEVHPVQADTRCRSECFRCASLLADFRLPKGFPECHCALLLSCDN